MKKKKKNKKKKTTKKINYIQVKKQIRIQKKMMN